MISRLILLSTALATASCAVTSEVNSFNQPRIKSEAKAAADFKTWDDYFTIEDIKIPKNIDPQIGGLTITKAGNVAAVFHGGDLAIYNPTNKTWQQYAEGLHQPLGIIEDEDGSLIVTQRSELTKLIDEDKDGQADFYKNLSNDFGISGNYHEFSFGPAKDQEGNLYFALNVASNFSGVYKHVRGEYSKFCPPKDIMEQDQVSDWSTIKKTAGRMFSCVPYRGWIMKVTPEGETIPYASGLRSPNGITVDDQNRLWVTDNQGDWRGTSPLYLVEEGDFLGHPASLAWKDGWKDKPLDMPISTLEALRKPAAALFPQGELANSPTKPISTTLAAKFGLPTNELLIGDMNQFQLIRYLPDIVDGVTQGTLIPFLSSTVLGRGNNRMAFDNDGNLWVGKIHLGWAGGEGIRKVSWKNEPYLIADQVKLTKEGFDIHFNHPLKSLPTKLEVTQHGYHYHADYGSPKVDLKNVTINNKYLSDDRKTLHITLGDITERQLYTISLKGVTNQNNKPLMGNVLRYNIVKRIK